eukprot:8605513-Pyramimonas_sp.AAC.1
MSGFAARIIHGVKSQYRLAVSGVPKMRVAFAKQEANRAKEQTHARRSEHRAPRARTRAHARTA